MEQKTKKDDSWKYAAGNMAVVCAALVPMTLRNPIEAHWMR